MIVMRLKRTATVARHAVDFLANVIRERAGVHPGRLKLSRRQADDRLLRLQFAIIIAQGNLRSCRGENYVQVSGLLLPDRTRMACTW